MTGGRRTFAPLQWMLLLGLLAAALWRGHHLIEQGSHAPPPTPRPAPREIAVVVTVDGLGGADALALSAALADRGWSACTGRLAAAAPAATLRRAVLHAGARPLCLRAISRTRGGPELPGEITLRHAEAPDAVLAARRILDGAHPAPTAVWLELADLAIPPPRPGAARRYLRRRGLALPPRRVLRRWLRAGRTGTEAVRPVLEALHHRGLDTLRRGLLALLAGGDGWLPSVLVVPAATGETAAGAPLLAAVPGDEPPPCPSLDEIGALLAGQKTWPIPR